MDLKKYINLLKNDFLKALFEQYKPFLLFLGKFFLSYLLLVSLYRFYLASTPDDTIDGITSNVSFLTTKIASVFGLDMLTKADFLQYQIIYKGKYIARIIEGCNAISVIILFTAFVYAFAGKLKPTMLYIIGGGVLIYILNILRIISFAILIYYFPEQEHLLHGVVFPLMIYGVVFVLWVYWVKNYSKYVSKSHE